MDLAVHIGVVISGGHPVRVINPTYEVELNWHHLHPGEWMVRLRKDAYGIGANMTPTDLARVLNDSGLSGIADREPSDLYV